MPYDYQKPNWTNVPPGTDPGTAPAVDAQALNDIGTAIDALEARVGTVEAAGSYSDEQARDAIAAALVAGTNVTIVPNDAANTITISATGASYTDEQARDAVGAALVGGTNITITPNDAGDTITVAVSGLTKSSVGLGNVDNTSDANKPVSTATQAAIDLRSRGENVRVYGAVGDGSTNDRTAINAAITAVQTAGGGGGVFFPGPNRIYCSDQKLTIPINIYLVGENPYTATLKLTAASTIATFLEFGATGTINVYGGIKGLQVDSNQKAQTGVLMYGPQEGAGIYEGFVLNSTQIAVDAVGTGIVGSTNMFEIARSWIWARGDAAHTGLRITGGLATIRSSTFVGTNRTVAPPAGSSGVSVIDGSVVTDATNAEYWEAGYRFTRSYGDVRSPQTAFTSYGLVTTSDSTGRIITLSGIRGWNNSVADITDAAGIVSSTSGTSSSCRVYASGTSQSLASGSTTTIDLSATEFNTDTGIFTVNLTANTITVAKAGTYQCAYELTFNGGSVGNRYANVLVNGTSRRVVGSGGVTTMTGSGASPVRLVAGDVVSLAGYVDGGTAVGVQAGAVYETGIALTYLGA